jgi:ribonuclease Z
VNFNVSILGSSSALPTSNRYPTAHLVNHDERFFLIDCGEGTQMQLRKNHLPMSKINHIFISHLHGDHVFGLIGFLSSLSMLNRAGEVHIHAHQPLEKYLNDSLKFFDSNLNFKLVFHALSDKGFTMVYEDKKLEIFSFPLLHRIPCCGFLFREKPKLLNLRKDVIEKYDIPNHYRQRIKMGEDFVNVNGDIIKNELLTLPPAAPLSYAFVTDTIYKPYWAKFLADIDLLYHESTFAHDDLKLARQTFHSTAVQAAQMAKLCNAKKLVIGHFSARYSDLSVLQAEAAAIFPNTYLANEGEKHVIN